MRITLVAGARPNFIKIAPLIAAIQEMKTAGAKIRYRLVHTGQHYDRMMSGNFFEQLQIPEPHINLNAGGGSQAEQTAQIMISFEKELIQNPTDLVLVVGDVTSTLACSITAKKLNIPVAHVEAGIRSGDLSMPEEINRIVTDSISDYFFTTTKDASKQLQKIGKQPEQIFFVGNVMIDTLLKFRPTFRKPVFFDELDLKTKNYLVLTLHRPSNVDEAQKLQELIAFICQQAKEIPVIFPVHPRTRQNYALDSTPENLQLTDPLGYLEFNYLVENALGVLTDSGGITEETTVLNIPCITLRENTERPETISMGTNELAGTDLPAIKKLMQIMLSGNWKQGVIPELWDGKSAKRIVEILLHEFKTSH
ncbi:MAG: UDP-N-acetylglucosamine 2-epimerase (non-hydrolyzing) [Flavobacteriaceae bacterium]|nr:UDP-N-acetylglucosamine 2-epimerase (non-hydrolyzing) [Flavobacteriaceae bacterium]